MLPRIITVPVITGIFILVPAVANAAVVPFEQFKDFTQGLQRYEYEESHFDLPTADEIIEKERLLRIAESARVRAQERLVRIEEQLKAKKAMEEKAAREKAERERKAREEAEARKVKEKQRASAASQPSRGNSRTRPATAGVTSAFGMRTHPITGVYKLHSGTDFGVGDGNAYAAADGVVSLSYPGWAGILVTVDHGGVQTTYAHLARATVSSGQKVRAGDVVGKIGSAGMATGPHLHFEVIKNGNYLNPLEWLGG